MVLYKKFRSTTFFNAFVLNAIILAIATVSSNIIFTSLKDYTDRIPIALNILITLLLVFIISLVIHILFFYFFAFGGGMLSPLHHTGPYKLFGH